MNNETRTLLILVNLAWVFLFSCATGKEYHTRVVYRNPPHPTPPVFLRAVCLEPLHSMRDYENLLPGVVTAMLTARGIKVIDNEDEPALSLEVLLQRKEYQRGYEEYESFILNLTLFEGTEPLIFIFHTEELASSISPAPLLWFILDKNLALLSEILTPHTWREKRKR